MEQYIKKSALVAEIERMIKHYNVSAKEFGDEGYNDNVLMEQCKASACEHILSFIDSLEVKEVGISIPNIDDTLKEEGLDPDSKEAKVFKESYYMALEKLKAQKGE